MEIQIRKIRATLNKSLQSRRTVREIKEDGEAFEALYGPSIWGCISQPGETFADLYNAHMARERENEEDRLEDTRKTENILSLLESCGMPDWYNLKAFIDRRPDLMDNQTVLDVLEERRIFLELPGDEDV